LTDIHPPTPSLLTKTELEWLMGKKKVSKADEYRIRSDIKKKLQMFQTLELPLLIQNGFLNELSVFTQPSANTQSNIEQLSLEKNHISTDNHHLPYKKSLERDLIPRPFPYQGNALPG
jgi:hypothetical protein